MVTLYHTEESIHILTHASQEQKRKVLLEGVFFKCPQLTLANAISYGGLMVVKVGYWMFDLPPCCFYQTLVIYLPTLMP